MARPLIDRIAAYKDRLVTPGRAARVAYPSESKKALFLWPEWRDNQPARMQVGDLETYCADGFELNSLIYSAIMYKVRAQQAVPLRAYRGDYKHPEALPESHPLAQLVSRPNPYQSWPEFQGVNTVYLNIIGNAFIYLDRPRGAGLPVAMYSLRPDRVFIVPKRDSRELLGFLYVPEGKSYQDGVPILPKDMIHVRLPNPSDPLEGLGYGLSPLASIAYSTDVDNFATKFLHTFFQSGAMVNGILKFDQPMAPEDIQGIKQRWKEMYGGFEKWGDIGVLDQAGSYERVGLTFAEMGFGELDERTESRILGPFGVSPVLLATRFGMNRSTNANYEQSRQQFWNDTFKPELLMFEQEYRYYLHGDGNEFVAFDFSEIRELQPNIGELANAYVELFTRGGLSKNAAAQVVGLDIPKLPDGDVVYNPFNLTSLGPNRAPQGQLPPALPAAGGESATTDNTSAAGAADAEDQQQEANAGAKARSPFRPQNAAGT